MRAVVAMALSSSEGVDIELVIPVCLVERVVHVESLVVHALILPLAVLIEDEHFLGDMVRVDHVQVEAVMLLHKAKPRGAPVVVLSDGHDVIDWKVDLLHTVHAQRVEAQVLGLGEQLKTQHKLLGREGRLNLERQKRVELRAGAAAAEQRVPRVSVSAGTVRDLAQVVELLGAIDEHG